LDPEHNRLLIVDDGEESGNIWTRTLEDMGYRVTCVADHQQALAMTEARSLDLVLLSIKTSNMAALQIVQRPGAAVTVHATPVIVLARADQLEDVEKYIQAGAVDYLVDPISPVLLKRRIQAILEQQRLQREAAEPKRDLQTAEKLAHDLVRIIVPLGIELSAEKNFDRLLEKILVEAKSVCNADAGTLYLRTDDNRLTFAIMRTDSLHVAMGGTTGKPIPYPPLPMYVAATGAPNHNNVATHVALEGNAVNIPDVYNAAGYDFSGTKIFDAKNGYRSTSSLTVPLKNYDAETIGVLQLLNAQDRDTGQVIAFDSYLQQVVESLASQAAVALNNKLLMDHQKTLLKYEHDVLIGQQIQAGFLPHELPKLPGWDIAAYYHPARQVGGDFYDAFPLRNQLAIVLGDVCDKGVGAALFMALFRSLIRALATQPMMIGTTEQRSGDATNKRLAGLMTDISALSTIIRTNDYVYRNHGDANMFATVFMGVLDPVSGLLTYVNGGHNPPAIIGAAGIKARLKPTGPAVGMFNDVQFDIGRVTLEPGDTLYIFTDGVTEIHSPTGELFSEKRLLPLIEQPASSPAQLVERVVTGLTAHRANADQFDDVTMVVLTRANTAT
jgi:phosphoserine phosphatase RsbU/P